MADAAAVEAPWNAAPGDLARCPWYGGHLAGDTLFVSDANQCPVSKISACPRASAGLRPESEACAWSGRTLPRRVVICATGTVVASGEWRTRVTEER